MTDHSYTFGDRVMTPDGEGKWVADAKMWLGASGVLCDDGTLVYHHNRDIAPLDNGPSKSEMEEYIGNLVSWGWHEGMKAEAERLARRIEESRKPVEVEDDPRIEVAAAKLAMLADDGAKGAESVLRTDQYWRNEAKDLLSRLDSVKEK